MTPGDSSPDPRRVFVIHGRNEPARVGLFNFLRSIGLQPIEWAQALQMTGKASPYIGEVLDAAFGAAQAVVVLQTPDDIAYLHPSLSYDGDPECDPQPQARPNVLFESGMAMGRSADRTVLVELGQVKAFSDIHGRHVVRLDNSVAKRQDLATRLSTAGCQLDLTGTDWHSSGDLTPPPPPGGGLPLGRKLPSSKATGGPRLDAHYAEGGSGRLGTITITNHGPGDVYDLDLEGIADNSIIRQTTDFPVAKLPEGKSVRAGNHAESYQRRESHFTLIAIGKTIDGVPIRQELFVSTG